MTASDGSELAPVLAPLSRAPFGAVNRQRLIAQFLDQRDPSSTPPLWDSVYRLLLWVDKTNGLGHCYESDKCQPGKPWYPRSLRFHDWLSSSLACGPSDVGSQVDWLFRRTADEFAEGVLRKHEAVLRKAAAQREGYGARGFPEPGEDPAIVAIIKDALGPRLLNELTSHEWVSLTQRIREVIAVVSQEHVAQFAISHRRGK